MAEQRITSVSVRAARPTYPYGVGARMYVKTGASYTLIRCGLPSSMPTNAIVTKAELVIMASQDLTGTRDVTAQRNASKFTTRTTWADKPALTGSGNTIAVGAATAMVTTFRIDVAPDVALWAAGDAVNYGWRLSTTDTNEIKFQGTEAANGAPWLDLDWLEPGDAPVDLAPDGGTVSVAKPVLTMTVPDGTTHIQVQLDDATDFATPVFDSGTVVSVGGRLRLVDTAYAGLADGAGIYWRARCLSAAGWSDYSEVAHFERHILPTPAITSPVDTAGDTTPPLAGTMTGLTAWRAYLYNDVTNKVIDRSGMTQGSSVAWTPTKGLPGAGSRGRYEVHFWDSRTDRIVTPADPGYAVATEVFDVVAAGVAPGPTTLTETPGILGPFVPLTWTYGTEPDQWQVLRNGKWLRNADGSLARVDGSVTTFIDYTAVWGVTYTYKVVAVSGGAVSTLSPSLVVTRARFGSVWIVDPDDGRKAVIWGEDLVEVQMPEQAAVHEVTGAAPRRRRYGLVPPRGSYIGPVIDDGLYLAQDSVDALMAFKAADAGHEYRVVFGQWNAPTMLEDITVSPTDIDDVWTASFTWQWADHDLPWDED